MADKYAFLKYFDPKLVATPAFFEKKCKWGVTPHVVTCHGFELCVMVSKKKTDFVVFIMPSKVGSLFVMTSNF